MTGNVPYYGNNFYFDAVFTRTVVGGHKAEEFHDMMECDNWPGAGRWTVREAST